MSALLVIAGLALLALVGLVIVAIVQPRREPGHPYRRRKNVIVAVERRKQRRGAMNVRNQVGPSLWWHVGPEPRIGDVFTMKGGTEFEVIGGIAQSEGGWLYETRCNAIGISRLDDPLTAPLEPRR